MTTLEQQLLGLLKERSFRLGDFRLSSGDRSSYYIDGRMSAVFSRGAYLIGEVIYDHTKEREVDAMGGLETGAIPLTTAAAIAYHYRNREMEGFWVRDQTKGHGTQKTIEGGLRAGSRVVIVDDVVTRGTSVVKAVEAVRELRCEVVLVLTLVDRLSGARELFSECGIKEYRSIFTIRDFG